MKSISLPALMLVLCFGCIKEDGKVPLSANTSGGGTDGNVETTGPDPLAVHAWHLENTGQHAFADAGGIAGKDISANEVTDDGITGAGVKVAVSDSGTDHLHIDLKKNSLTTSHRNYTFIDSQFWRGSLPTTTDHDAHGTAVTGLIAARGWNGVGSRGVAPDAKFAAFKFVTNYSSSISNASMLARVVDQTDGDFDIFNYSYGYTDCIFVEEDELVLDALQEGVTFLRNGKGAIYIQSAGNGYVNYLKNCTGVASTLLYAHNTNFSSDTATPHKIIVSAVNANGLSSSYSSPGSGIWISAPGGEYGDDEPAMMTTDISGCNYGYSRSITSLNSFNKGKDGKNPYCDYTSLMNGTSAAAPVASGVVALMLQAQPRLSWRDVKHILATTSQTDLIDSQNSILQNPTGLELAGYIYDRKWNLNRAGYFFSNWYGFGMINAKAAVDFAKSYSFPLGAYETTANPNTGEWYYSSGPVGLTIPDADADGITSTINVDHNYVVEAVQVKVNITHAKPGELAVQLKSPAGLFESRLLYINSNVYAASFPADKILLTNAFYGEESAGTWTIKIVDGTAGTAGTLDNWSILIHGHKVTSTANSPSPVSNIVMNATSNSDSFSPVTTFSASPSGSVIRYEVSVGSTYLGSDKAKWYSIGNNTSFQVTGLELENNKTYYLNIRAVDSNEKRSTVRSKFWKVEL